MTEVHKGKSRGNEAISFNGFVGISGRNVSQKLMLTIIFTEACYVVADVGLGSDNGAGDKGGQH